MTDLERADLLALMQISTFRKFVLMIVTTSGVFAPSTNGNDGRNLHFAEGRRSLGLEVMQHLEDAQTGTRTSPLPVRTAIQILSDAAQTASKENTIERSGSIYGDIDSDG